LVKKPTRTQLEKYDINQKIFQELAHLESRHIIFSIIKKAKTAEEISDHVKIPLASVYKKLHDLEDLSLIYVEKMDFSYNGRRIRFYKSRVKNVEIIIKKNNPQIVITRNK
jgi:predicted transcriptional regulator